MTFAPVVLALVLAWASVLGGSVGTAAAEPAEPARPEQLLFDSNRTGNFEIYVMGTDGSDVRQLTDDPSFDSWWPVGSPDGTRILFYRNRAGSKHPDYTSNSLWMVDADGNDVHQLLAADANGWSFQGHAEWSPDGNQLVMFGGSPLAPSLQITAADGTSADARPGAAPVGTGVLDPAWGPAGLVYVSCAARPCRDTGFEIYRAAADGSDPHQLTDDDVTDNDPAWSPDGRQIAWLRRTGTRQVPLMPNAPVWAIYLMNADGSDRHAVIDDGNINSKPAWSPDGSTIYFHRLVYGGEKGFQIWRIAPDGSGLTELTQGQPGSNEFPVAFTPAATASTPSSDAGTTAPGAPVEAAKPAAKKNPLGGLIVLGMIIVIVALLWRRLRRRHRQRSDIGS